MKSCCILIATIFCLIVVEGQIYYQEYTNSEENENSEINNLRNRSERRIRNRREPYHENYVRKYQSNEIGVFLKNILYSVKAIETHVKQGSSNRYYPGYDDDRRNYSNKCQDSIHELLTISKELLLHLKHPPPPPPPSIINIHFPYPSMDNVASNVKVNTTEVNDRVLMSPKDNGTEDDGDGFRDISFKPIQPKRQYSTPPPFEHGSRQEGVRFINHARRYYPRGGRIRYTFK